MKRKAVGFLIVAAFAIALTGCNFNLFGALDKLKVPNADELLNMATNNAADFVSQVQDYVDSGSVTADNADSVVAALEDVYASPPDTETGQKAAVLAGEISITAHPETKLVVDNVVGAFTAMMDPNYVAPTGETDTEVLVKGLFPTTDTDFHSIYTNLQSAAAAYKDFADTIDTNNDGIVDSTDSASWVDDAEKRDIATYGIVSIAVTTIDETTLHNFLYGSGDLGSTDPVNDSTELLALLDFANISLQ